MFSHLYFVFVFVQIISARVRVFTCKNNEDCPNGHACHKGTCIVCFKCAFILRKGNDCVIDFKECGECLEGYEKVALTKSSNIVKPCIPVRLKEKSNKHDCTDDNTCPPGYYCHYGSCRECFNCNLLNRLSPIGHCPKVLSDCGSCTNGFKEVAVATSAYTKLCGVQTAKVMPEAVSMVAFSSFASIFLIALVLMGLYASLFIKKPKVKILSKSRCPEQPSAPPLNIIDTPRRHVEMLEEERGFDVALVREQMQQAKVFRQPAAFYYYYWEDETRGGVRRESENGEQNNVPSLWAPAASNEADGETVHPEGVSGEDYHGQIAVSSETDSPTQPSEISPRAPGELGGDGDNPPRDSPIEGESNDTDEGGKNPSD